MCGPQHGPEKLKAKASCRRPPNIKKCKNIKNVKNENRQKRLIFVDLRLWEHQNRIRHVNKPLHAKYELRSCRERRVMTILHKKNMKNHI